MNLLHSELHYYPDARRRESVRLGSLLFTKDAEGADARCVVAFYGDPSALIQAQKLSANEFFFNVFGDFNTYVGSVAGTVIASKECSEEEIARLFIANLPHNIKANKPEPWPPNRVFTDAARNAQPIMAHLIESR